MIEKKIIHQMGRLGYSHQTNRQISDSFIDEISKISLMDEEIEMTAEDYDKLLEKYEEVEDLTCTICFDKMRLGDVIVRTLCSTSL